METSMRAHHLANPLIAGPHLPRTCLPRRAQIATHCSNNQSPENEHTPSSRRNALSQLCLGITAVAIAETSAPAPAQALPGFKKDLTNNRRKVIPEELFTTDPAGFKYYDITVGDGAEAKFGSRVVVHFDAKWRGITFVTSRQGAGVTGGVPLGFDVGAPFGQGGTLTGLDLGVRGMKVGGQRQLLVPPELAYGKNGYGEIPGNATLTIDVQLLSIKQNALGARVKLVEG